MIKKQTVKKEVYFIATKLKSKPLSVSFYTKEGQAVPNKAVTKKITVSGTRFYATV